MVCFKCDRCGETYDFYGRMGNDKLCANAIAMNLVYTDESLEKIDEFHLCPDCMDRLNHWLTNQEDTETESFIEQTESSLKETFVSVHDVWGMVADVIVNCEKSINNMDKERKRHG